MSKLSHAQEIPHFVRDDRLLFRYFPQRGQGVRNDIYPRYFKLRDFMRLKFFVLKTFESE